jgi:hypothetical protein
MSRALKYRNSMLVDSSNRAGLVPRPVCLLWSEAPFAGVTPGELLPRATRFHEEPTPETQQRPQRERTPTATKSGENE